MGGRRETDRQTEAERIGEIVRGEKGGDGRGDDENKCDRKGKRYMRRRRRRRRRRGGQRSRRRREGGEGREGG